MWQNEASITGFDTVKERHDDEQSWNQAYIPKKNMIIIIIDVLLLEL